MYTVQFRFYIFPENPSFVSPLFSRLFTILPLSVCESGGLGRRVASHRIIRSPPTLVRADGRSDSPRLSPNPAAAAAAADETRRLLSSLPAPLRARSSAGVERRHTHDPAGRFFPPLLR